MDFSTSFHPSTNFIAQWNLSKIHERSWRMKGNKILSFPSVLLMLICLMVSTCATAVPNKSADGEKDSKLSWRSDFNWFHCTAKAIIKGSWISIKGNKRETREWASRAINSFRKSFRRHFQLSRLLHSAGKFSGVKFIKLKMPRTTDCVCINFRRPLLSLTRSTTVYKMMIWWFSERLSGGRRSYLGEHLFGNFSKTTFVLLLDKTKMISPLSRSL